MDRFHLTKIHVLAKKAGHADCKLWVAWLWSCMASGGPFRAQEVMWHSMLQSIHEKKNKHDTWTKKLTSHAYWNQKSVFQTTSIQAPNWCLASNFVLEFAIGRMTVKARFQCNMRSAQRASWGRATSCASFRYADNNLANQVLSECEWVRLACQSSRQAQ